MRWLSLVVLLASGCAAAPPSAPPSAGLNPTDAAYVRLAIPQAESALPLLDLISTRSSDSALAGLARGAAEERRAELARWHGVLSGAGVGYTNEHEGHDMPGMVTAGEVEAVRGLAGGQFDARARVLLKAHCEESAAVAAVALEAAEHPEVVRGAEAVRRSREDCARNLSIP